MISEEEFHSKALFRYQNNLCQICENPKFVNGLGEIFILCKRHLDIWTLEREINKINKWAYHQYKKELIENTINVWKK